jgi:hypothetical protein
MGSTAILKSLLFLTEHMENQFDEVHAGVPLAVFEQQTEDEQIEAMLRELIAEEDDPLQSDAESPIVNGREV